MIKSASEAIKRAQYLVDTNFNYIYGYKFNYNPVTVTIITQLAKDNPSNFTTEYTAKAKAMAGENAIDCSGLVCYALSISDIGSYAIADLPKTRPNQYKEVPLAERKPGDIVWKKGHVGLMKTTKSVIEARSMSAGVKEFLYTSQPWAKCIRPLYKETEDGYTKTGWIYEPDGRCWYAKSTKKGDYYKSGIYTIDGKQYLFDKDGYLLSGLLIITNDDGSIRHEFSPQWKK